MMVVVVMVSVGLKLSSNGSIAALVKSGRDISLYFLT